jgi:hypothetical protein
MRNLLIVVGLALTVIVVGGVLIGPGKALHYMINVF